MTLLDAPDFRSCRCPEPMAYYSLAESAGVGRGGMVTLATKKRVHLGKVRELKASCSTIVPILAVWDY